MNGRAYYNENDPAAGAILRELIARNAIMPGDVDDRSIKDVQPSDLAGYAQCHFFAGGGLWSVAARLAGWPDERPLWTGSCPCQPFSAAGKGHGTDDPRHLWPDFHRLIRACRPVVVMGEQVAGAAGYGWFDGVRADLATEDYASRCIDIPACAVDAPHQRNRMYWVAMDNCDRQGRSLGSIAEVERGNLRFEGAHAAAPDVGANGCRSLLQPHARRELRRPRPGFAQNREVGSNHYGFIQSDAHRGRRSGWAEGSKRGQKERTIVERADVGLQPDADEPEFQGQPSTRQQSFAQSDARSLRSDDGLHLSDDMRLSVPGPGRGSWGQQYALSDPQQYPGSVSGLSHPWRNGSWWSDSEWLVSPLDGKARRAKPGIPFLVDGLPGRVDLWRVGGNAIVPILAAEVIAAFLETEAIGATS